MRRVKADVGFKWKSLLFGSIISRLENVFSLASCVHRRKDGIYFLLLNLGFNSQMVQNAKALNGDITKGRPSS